MAKGQRKVSLKPNPLSLTLLLVQFILIKIGNLPLWLIKSSFKIAKGGILRTQRALESTKSTVSESARGGRKTLALASKKARLPTEAFRFHRGRGRPRKTPFIPFYLYKLNRAWRKIPKKFKIATASLIIMLAFLSYTSLVLNAAYQLPSPDRLVSPNQPLTTEFYDRGGKLLYRLYEGRNRTLVTLDELPKDLIQATIAIEDKNFYQHGGVDFEAVGRALYHNFLNREDNNLQGASTLTQQLVKNSLLTPEKTYTRKLKEIILAFWTERIYSKNQILQMYFNEAPYGGPAWGIEAASQVYFGKSAKNLNLSESAFLAGLPASPTQFSPFGTQPELAKIRQKEVLARMAKEGYISSAKAEEAYLEPLNLKPPVNNIHAPHFVFYIKDYLSQKYSPRVVSQGGLKITTTLDLSLQEQVEAIISTQIDTLSPLNVKNGAAMVTDAKTGQILAMMGSRDYHYPNFGNFNVTLSLRQPGSSIKVVTYSAAFKKGFSPGNTVLDTPVSFKDGQTVYSPVNYDGRFHGPVSIRVALGSSYNVPAVKMLATIGLDDVVQTGKDLGITSWNDPKNYGLSLTLGGADVKMIEMMALYGTFSQMGRLSEPTGILKVTDSSGNILEEYKDSSKEVISPDIAYLITHILSDDIARTPAFGSNSLLKIDNQAVAVKTGTSDNKRDNWTFGYTPEYVVGVWVGNNDNSPMNPALTSGVTGAAPIWNKIMRGILTMHPSLGFARPAGITESLIDGRKDLAIARNIPKSLVRVRKDEDKTIFSDAFSSFATPSAQAAVKNGATN